MTTKAVYVKDREGEYLKATTEEVLSYLHEIVTRNFENTKTVDCGIAARDIFITRLSRLKYETFAVLFLDTQNRIIEYEEMFRGTYDRVEIFPREIARKALETNATGVIVGHNHPTSAAIASESDIAITNRIKTVLEIVDTKLLDHIIVDSNFKSFIFSQEKLL